jgi:hypothetical protein
MSQKHDEDEDEDEDDEDTVSVPEHLIRILDGLAQASAARELPAASSPAPVCAAAG